MPWRFNFVSYRCVKTCSDETHIRKVPAISRVLGSLASGFAGELLTHDRPDECFYMEDRKQLFEVTREQRRVIHRQLQGAFRAVPDFATELGLDPALKFEVHELRRAMRIAQDGRYIPQLVVALTQSKTVHASDTKPFLFRGGSTLVVDLSVPAITYRIVKNINSKDRTERTATFVRAAAADPLRALLLMPGSEPFAALHAVGDSSL